MDKFSLNIYYRDIAASESASGDIIEKSSLGHIYVSLESNGEEQFFGRYPSGWFHPYTSQEIRTESEKEHHNRVQMFSNNTGQDHISIKKISLTEEQYHKALKHAELVKEQAKKDQPFMLGLNDCIDFAQSVYNAAGLPLYFTQIYSSDELSKLRGLASYKMANKILGNKYGSRDELKNFGNFPITGFSKQELASSLNIPIERIEEYKSMDADITLPQFKIKLLDSDLLSEKQIATIKFQNDDSVETLDLSKLNLNSDANSTFEHNHTNNFLSDVQFLMSYVMQLKKKISELKKKAIDKFENLLKSYQDEVREKTKQVGENITEDINSELEAKKSALQQQLDRDNLMAKSQKQSELDAEVAAIVAAYNAQITAGVHSVPPQTDHLRAMKQQEYEQIVNQKGAYYQSLMNAAEKEAQSKISNKLPMEIKSFHEKCREKEKLGLKQLNDIFEEIARDVNSMINDAVESIKLGKRQDFKQTVDIDRKIEAKLANIAANMSVGTV